jgi:hypothetical protein
MLSGVSTKYGRNSNEYRKAGGSLRKSKTAAQPTPSMTSMTLEVAQPTATEITTSTNGKSVSKAQVA